MVTFKRLLSNGTIVGEASETYQPHVHGHTVSAISIPLLHTIAFMSSIPVGHSEIISFYLATSVPASPLFVGRRLYALYTLLLDEYLVRFAAPRCRTGA